jgi:hypothetical protein
MRNFAEMNLREETVSITARGRDALSKSLVTHPRTGPRTAALRPIQNVRAVRAPAQRSVNSTGAGGLP